MFNGMNGLYIISPCVMLLGYVFARLHGRASEVEDKYKERIWEFGRNASIQFSAMIFALALAFTSLDRQISSRAEESAHQVESKEHEQAALEASVASSAVAERAAAIQRALRHTLLKNAPQYAPNCVYRPQIPKNVQYYTPSDIYNQECRKRAADSIQAVSSHAQSIEFFMQSIIDSFDIRDDWLKYRYFSKNLDKRILADFLSAEHNLYQDQDYLIFFINSLQNEKTINGEATDKELIYLDNVEILLDHFTKRAFIYLAMYYVTFGDLTKNPDKIRRDEVAFLEAMQKDSDTIRTLSLLQFGNTLSQEILQCHFEGFECSELIGHFAIQP